MTYNPKFVASDEVRQDNIRAMSRIWKRWCEFNSMPKHENGQYYSADDIMLDHYQDMPFEPTTKQVQFLSAFREVWEQIESIEMSAL
jgi:hypothetical protein|tara:strand:+ start:192 stop:452 length:261 start_codon:yes stop_codon:yes gene_type:complete